AQLEESVEDSARDPCQIERGGPGPTHVLECAEGALEYPEVARDPFLMAEGETGPDDRPLRRPDADVAPRGAAGALPGGAGARRPVPRLAQEGRMHCTGQHGVFVDERDGDPDGPEPVEVVRRSVERVDHPSEPGGGATQ